jgi:signal transduction histidine kinase
MTDVDHSAPDTEHLLQRLAATNELLTIALAGASMVDIRKRAVELAALVTHADGVWLVVGDGSGPFQITSQLADQECPEWLDRLLADPARGWVERSGCKYLAPDLAPGPTMVVPYETIGAAGYVVIARHAGRPGFDANDESVAIDFTRAAAITLGLAGSRAEMEVLRSVADHERIARDLHDVVIQRLYAIAMGLESVIASSPPESVAAIGDSVDQLDEVIRSIRTTIFNLRRPSVWQGGLKAAIADEVDAAATLLGFAPALRFRGLVDTGVPGATAAEAVAVVRELLSNVVRHSHAREAEVAIAVGDGWLTITVADDGMGIPDDAPRGDGLSNVAARAALLGGSVTVDSTAAGGARMTWRVPVE